MRAANTRCFALTTLAYLHLAQSNAYQGPYVSQDLPLARIKRVMKVASCFNPRVSSCIPPMLWPESGSSTVNEKGGLRLEHAHARVAWCGVYS